MPRYRFYETQRYYEVPVVLRPDLSEEEVSKKGEEIKGFITKKGGEFLKLKDWGTKELSYKIKKYNRGRYLIVWFKTKRMELPNELDFQLKIDTDVLRHLIFRVKEKDVK